MGVYKICEHKGRARDRCDHAWWGSFRGKRVSLEKWANRDIETKAAAGKALDDLRAAIRAGTFDERGLEPPVETSPLTFSTFAEAYKQRHVLAKGLALADTIDYRLKPLIERFGDRLLSEIKTADIEDFVADLKKPRVVNSIDGRTLSPASINRTLGLLRHMLNWAVGPRVPSIGRRFGAAPKSSFDWNARTTSGAGEYPRKRRPPCWRLPHPTCDR